MGHFTKYPPGKIESPIASVSSYARFWFLKGEMLMRIGGNRKVAGFAAGAIALLLIITGCATGGGNDAPAGNSWPAMATTASPAKARPQPKKTQPKKTQPTRTLTAVAPPSHQAPAPPAPAQTAPAAAAPPAPPASTAPASCHPLSNEGNCYEPGEYCRNSDHGTSGVAGDGEAITCEDNGGWRWEPV